MIRRRNRPPIAPYKRGIGSCFKVFPAWDQINDDLILLFHLKLVSDTSKFILFLLRCGPSGSTCGPIPPRSRRAPPPGKSTSRASGRASRPARPGNDCPVIGSCASALATELPGSVLPPPQSDERTKEARSLADVDSVRSFVAIDAQDRDVRLVRLVAGIPASARSPACRHHLRTDAAAVPQLRQGPDSTFAGT